jgi:hypothetical protein
MSAEACPPLVRKGRRLSSLCVKISITAGESRIGAAKTEKAGEQVRFRGCDRVQALWGMYRYPLSESKDNSNHRVRFPYNEYPGRLVKTGGLLHSVDRSHLLDRQSHVCILWSTPGSGHLL